uniref:Protein TsetseEP domain-containing protein n=1 Tax=Anopheles dirus TaxID=7168 RepID=A0A182NKP5_9DIPT
MDRVGLIILLFQCALIVASPDYGLPNSVSGTASILSRISLASSYVETLAPGQLVPAAVTQTAFGLPTIVQILQGTGKLVSEDGAAIALAMSTLTESKTGDPAALFDAVAQSIQSSQAHITQLLPTARSGLSALLGDNVPDRLTDGFARLNTGLQTLAARLDALKAGVLAAIAEAGSATTISTPVLTKHITARMVYDVLRTVQDLRAYLPVIRYTLNTTLEDAVEADAFLNRYETALASAETLVGPVIDSFFAAQESFYASLKSSVKGLAAFYDEQKQQILDLPMNGDPALGAAIGAMLDKYTTTLSNHPADIVAVASRLSSDLTALKALVANTDPEIISFADSKLIGALIHTLIDSGVYSRFCYHKYKDLVIVAVAYLAQESSNCIEREIPRLGHLVEAVKAIVDTERFDFEDILDWMTICNELQDPTKKSECVQRISSSYTPLGDYFADKYDLLYDLTYTELNACKQRLNICVQLSKRALTLGYVPELQAAIERCAATGPTNVYEMNRLVLAFGLVCLLQGLSAEPRPEFGISLTLDATDRITAEKANALGINAEIKALVVAPIASGMAKLSVTKTQIETVITAFDAKTTPIGTAYDTLLAATDGNIDNAFGPFNTAIDGAIAYITTDAAAITTALTTISYSGISDQLTDAFQRIAAGLTDLKTQAGNVKTALAAAQAAANPNALTATFLRQYLSLRKMYDLLRSVTNLRAYLPLVKYILTTTIENLAEADTFVGLLKTTLANDVGTKADQYKTALKEVTDSITASIAADMTADGTATGTIYTNVDAMTAIKNAPKIADLTTALGSLRDLFLTSANAAQTTTMTDAFTHIGTSMEALITTLKAAISVTDDTLVNLLIDTLVGTEKYGRYCYHKYKYLVYGLFTQAFDGGWQCVDKEYERLQHLKATVEQIIDLLTFDYEDIEAQVGVCNQLTIPADLNACVAALAPYYTELFKATKDKIAAAYTLATDEAAASENRLLICLRLVNLDVTVLQEAALLGKLQICAAQGANGSD